MNADSAGVTLSANEAVRVTGVPLKQVGDRRANWRSICMAKPRFPSIPWDHTNTPINNPNGDCKAGVSKGA